VKLCKPTQVPQVEIPQRETLSHAQNYLKKKNKKRGLK
jgi:hypothetical protein